MLLFQNWKSQNSVVTPKRPTTPMFQKSNPPSPLVLLLNRLLHHVALKSIHQCLSVHQLPKETVLYSSIAQPFLDSHINRAICEALFSPHPSSLPSTQSLSHQKVRINPEISILTSQLHLPISEPIIFHKSPTDDGS
jgi:hypothetical protein